MHTGILGSARQRQHRSVARTGWRKIFASL